MMTNDIYERYNNLKTAEEYANNYSYGIKKIKNLELSKIKKPQKFVVNKLVENFNSNKKGILKTLQEFQNLYFHKFIIDKKKPEKIILLRTNKENSNFNVEHLDLNNNIITLFYDINNSGKNPQISFSKIDTLKSSSVLSKQIKRRRSSIFLREKNNNVIYKTHKNKNMTQSLLLKNNSNNNNSNNNNRMIKKKSSSILLRRDKSKLSLMKEITEMALNNDYYSDEKKKVYKDLKKSQKFLNKNNYIKNINKIINRLKNLESSKDYKNNIELIRRNNKYNNIKFIEVKRDNFNFSDNCIILRQKFQNSERKLKLNKRPKIPLRLFSSNLRPLSTLERYYLKFGVYPYY